jgi:hypothetical protein
VKPANAIKMTANAQNTWLRLVACGLAQGLHRLPAVCIGSNPCRPTGTYVNVGFDTGYVGSDTRWA